MPSRLAAVSDSDDSEKTNPLRRSVPPGVLQGTDSKHVRLSVSVLTWLASYLLTLGGRKINNGHFLCVNFD